MKLLRLLLGEPWIGSSNLFTCLGPGQKPTFFESSIGKDLENHGT